MIRKIIEDWSWNYIIECINPICVSVEFPAVLLNTGTGAIDAEFHHYVQPQEHPYLSDFCRELTGITQVVILIREEEYYHKESV